VRENSGSSVDALIAVEASNPSDRKKCPRCGHFNAMRLRVCEKCCAQLPLANDARAAATEAKRCALSDITNKQSGKKAPRIIDETAKFMQ
jgi:hypothetical protein